MAVRTHQQIRVKSCKSCRVRSIDAARSIFVSQSLVIEHGSCYFEEDMDVKKLILLVKNNEAIYASHYELRNWDYIASVWMKIELHNRWAQVSGALHCFFSYFDYDNVHKNSCNSNNSDNVLIVKVFTHYFLSSEQLQPTFFWLQIKYSVICL
jgi:hypothetical protein